MIVEPFAADPTFPGLRAAGDAGRMRRLFERHLRPAGGTPYRIEGCRLARVRYRRGERCVMQYALDLRDPATGARREHWVAGVMYAGEKARRKWEKRSRSMPEVPGAPFEPVAFVPDLGMLVSVFPYDRRLPGLPPLMAGPSGEVLDRLGAHLGRPVAGCDAALVRYRAELGATVRLAVRIEAGTPREHRLYAKVYHDESGARTHEVLRTLGGARSSGFSVGRPVAYLEDSRVLIQEETPGVPLRDLVLGEEREARRAVRAAAAAVASLHLLDVDAPRAHSARDEARELRRARDLLTWACPHLSGEIEGLVDAVVSGPGDGPGPSPTHRDLKPDHVLLDGERAGFIDLDDFAASDPLLDAADLMAHLGGMHLLSPDLDERMGADLAAEFAETYFARVPAHWSAGLPARQAGAVLKMAVGFFRRREAGWPEKIRVLLETARGSLAGRSR